MSKYSLRHSVEDSGLLRTEVSKKTAASIIDTKDGVGGVHLGLFHLGLSCTVVI
jgi:hypothetical protein